MRHWLFRILFFAILYSGFTESSSYTTNTGYSRSNSHNDYIPGARPGSLNRYLYSAFQHGYIQGNLQTNLKFAGFQWDPNLRTNLLMLTDPGHSKVDLYFKQDPRYFLRSANLSILEKLTGYEIGKIRIEVNGRNLIANHSARHDHRFDESTWDMTSFCNEGLNHISIQLEANGGRFALLGIKVETRENLKSGGDNNDAYFRFVNRVFQRYHNRKPTHRELSYYTGLLSRGVKTKAEVQEMIRRLSPVHGDHFEEVVSDYFQRYTHRQPTPDELQYYSQKLRRNEITLPQLKAICEGLHNDGGNNQGIEPQIRTLFMEILGRYPTDSELSFYANRVRSGNLSWQALRQEIAQLGGHGSGGFGLSKGEVDAIQFSRYELTHSFWNKLEHTTDQLLRELLQRANYTQMYGTNNEIKTVAGQIYRRIREIQLRRNSIH